ncbi:MAG: proline--tRNA ligase [Kiritimatiellaeota bacterium]|nr:proline--tRNA ligase [Kiritimatiellota bacterium]
MRWTRTLIATLRDDPQEAEIVSHKLMMRAGLLCKLGGGLYTFTPLGLKALRKVEAIVREEMDRAGALEILMPALQPIELWETSGRAGAMGASMFQLKDRAQRAMVLGPTHEEVVTDFVAKEVSSYRQLPCTLYQIQTKFRDEIRPRFGLMRAKEFIMKDAYSFDVSWDAADASYQAMYDAYVRIFARCGLRVKAVEADTGDMGGNHSHEFMVPAESGEDGIVECPACSYAANMERAERKVVSGQWSVASGENASEPSSLPAFQPVSTPGVHTVEAVAAFLKVAPSQLIKTLIYMADEKPIALLLPGDREANEPKIKRALGCAKLVPAEAAVVEKVTGAPVGFAGPVGLSIPIYADRELEGAEGRVTGANKGDTHLLGVSVPRDVAGAIFMDLVVCKAGDLCPKCGAALAEARGIEVGHVFKLGTKYTKAFDASYLDGTGKAQTMVMGCYGIGVTRTLQAIVEQNFDANGICWPVATCPYAVDICLLDPKDAACAAEADRLEKELTAAGIDVIVDDRDERPGVKLKDADLIGFPCRVVVGAKALAKGGVEVKLRSETAATIVPLAEAVASIQNWVASARIHASQ